MNKVILSGRLASEPQLTMVGENKDLALAFCILAVAEFSKGERKVEFFRIKAFGKNANNLCEFKSKGNFLEVCGRLSQTVQDDKVSGKRYYGAEVIIGEMEFGEYVKKATDPQTGKEEEYTVEMKGNAIYDDSCPI
ncbi:MAG: single-stranded DNA-binding protein [Clostridium paraputrificum]|uniref:single-stranded DNA-binding protein n=1 Tax=Clostridium sp. TaxID=1506 RepID=UPI0025C0B5A3|nr:single-stranded DNA-binding protein [Clostridium sp.]MBS5926141.1 single-stranded DNA-binding protein [Clostridium sp.]